MTSYEKYLRTTLKSGYNTSKITQKWLPIMNALFKDVKIKDEIIECLVLYTESMGLWEGSMSNIQLEYNHLGGHGSGMPPVQQNNKQTVNSGYNNFLPYVIKAVAKFVKPSTKIETINNILEYVFNERGVIYTTLDNATTDEELKKALKYIDSNILRNIRKRKINILFGNGNENGNENGND